MLKRGVVFAWLLLLACVSLTGTNHGTFKLVAIAQAKSGKSNGNGNGNSGDGNANADGNGAGNATGNTGNGNGAGEAGETDQGVGGQSIGDDFRNEGFAPSGIAAEPTPIKPHNTMTTVPLAAIASRQRTHPAEIYTTKGPCPTTLALASSSASTS